MPAFRRVDSVCSGDSSTETLRQLGVRAVHVEQLDDAASRLPATLILSMQAAAPAPRPSPQSVESALGLTRAQRVQVQRGLTALGFDVGAADGVLGPRSRAAIAEWQSSRDEAATGYLDADTADILVSAGEAASPRTPNPEPRTPNPEPRTPNPEPRTPNPEDRRTGRP